MSLILDLARESILEVMQALKRIDKEALLKENPILHEILPVTVNIYHEGTLFSSFTVDNLSLVDAIIVGSKKAAFADKEKLFLTNAFFKDEIEVVLHTGDGDLSHRQKLFTASS